MSEIRLRKVESLLKEEISSMISKKVIKDPRIDPLVAITSLIVSKDLKYSKVYVSFYGEKEVREQCVRALNHASGFIQRSLGKRLHLKTIPKLTFYQDDSIEQGFRITQGIKELLS